MIEEGIISSMMVGDGTMSQFKTVTVLMGETAIPALVSV
jgi:hypothetical protein